MSGLLLLDSFARGGTLALLTLWSWLLLRDHREALAARLAVMMNLGIACHVIASMPGIGIAQPFDSLIDMGSVTVAALFWLFARAWFADEQRIGWASWAMVPTAMVLVVLATRNYPTRNLTFLISAVLLRLNMFGFAAAGLWLAWRGREGDLIEVRRRLRWRLVLAVGLFVILINLIEVLVALGLLPDYWRSLVEIGVTMLTLIFCVAMFGIRQADLLGAPQRSSRTVEPLPVDELLAARLRAYMDAEKPWRDETLTIAALAARLGEQEYRLRRLINRALGHRNFAQFLNAYRLGEVRQALADPAQREVPILTIALDAGFGSLGPFNRAFREAEGATPSEYRSRVLADSGIG